VSIALSLLSPPGSELLDNATALSFTGVPIAVGIAILRYRLYEIDILINRALVYGSLSVTLVGLYVGGVAALQRIFVALTGQQSTLAIVASTLAIAALFNPLRGRIQSFIDRRFYRRKYDSRKTLESFSATLRDGPGRLGRRAGGGGQGDDAAHPCLSLAASRHSPEARSGTLADLYALNSVEEIFSEEEVFSEVRIQHCA